MLSSAFAAVIPSGLRAHEESLLPKELGVGMLSTPVAARKRDAPRSAQHDNAGERSAQTDRLPFSRLVLMPFVPATH